MPPAPDNLPALSDSLRIGHGYDLHRLEPPPPAGKGRAFTLGGVRLEHPVGPVGHSDGDALYHAVVDAILGALGQPDIGQLFPDTDPRHDNEDSGTYLHAAAERMRALGFELVNLDATVILEKPKLSPEKDRMRANLARHLAVSESRINLKGKTHEKVDAVGEGRAVEVHVVVLLSRRADA